MAAGPWPAGFLPTGLFFSHTSATELAGLWAQDEVKSEVNKTERSANLKLVRICNHAKVAELADAPDLGSGTARCGGSSPPFRTKINSDLKGITYRKNGCVTVV